MPIKRWWIERIVKELNKNGPNGSGDGGSPSRALHTNSPDVRAMQARARTQVPSRLRRFT